MTADSSGWPYPPPASTADGIVQLLDQADKESSVFQAVAPGTTTLSSRGLYCPASDQDFSEPCSILALTVTP